MSEELSDIEYKKRRNKTIDEFCALNNDNIYDLYLEMNEYCNDNMLDIFNNYNAYGELVDFILNDTLLVDNLLERNIIEENNIIKQYEENNFETEDLQ